MKSVLSSLDEMHCVLSDTVWHPLATNVRGGDDGGDGGLGGVEGGADGGESGGGDGGDRGGEDGEAGIHRLRK